uniref:DRBM domain-containing protein n=1 Tax=Chenopodium quinoa TaxID=63459 RepID=A0A803KRD7_CHEQI
MYKSKLQEMCVVKSWTCPKYSVIKDGPDHNLLFTASVFVNGSSFDSPTFCKSVKEAQNKAAEAALIHFISLSSARPYPGNVISKDGSKMKETNKSILPAESKEGEKLQFGYGELLIFKNSKSDANKQEKETEAVNLDMKSLSLEEFPQDTGPKLAEGREPKSKSKSKTHGKINPTEDDGSLIQGEKALASADKSSGSEKQKDPEVTSFLLCNRVRVYTYVPEIANLPKGVTVLQVCENKWVAVSLDFPNEKGN